MVLAPTVLMMWRASCRTKTTRRSDGIVGESSYSLQSKEEDKEKKWRFRGGRWLSASSPWRWS